MVCLLLFEWFINHALAHRPAASMTRRAIDFLSTAIFVTIIKRARESENQKSE